MTNLSILGTRGFGIKKCIPLSGRITKKIELKEYEEGI